METPAANQAAATPQEIEQPSEAMLADVGRLVSHFALLERGLTDFAHALLGVPDNVARRVTAELSLTGVRHLVASLIEESAPGYSAELRKLYKRIDRAESHKDALLYHLWGYSAPEERRKRGACREPGLPRGVLTHQGLLELAADIVDITRGLDRLRRGVSLATKPAAQHPVAR